VLGVTLAKEAPPPFTGLKKHSVTARVRGSIGHAVLNHVHVHAGAQGTLDALLLSALDDFVHGEINLLGMFAVEERRRDPDLVSDLYRRSVRGGCGHFSSHSDVPTFNTL